VVSAATDSTLLSAYAVRQASGGLDLLVVNKNPTADLTQQIQLQNYRPSAAAHVWQYGKAEDTAQSHTVDGSAALSSTSATLTLNGSTFNYTFPSYSMTLIELAPAAAAVAGRYTFYNHSALDGNNAAATAADDGAVAADKQALRPGDAAGFANVTSYSRGINGVMVDVAALPLDRTPTAGDFVLETLNGAAWTTLGTVPAVSVRRNAGTSGTDRITLVLPDGAVNNTWLRVTVKPTVNTGLKQSDVFSFGNLVGETGSAPALAVNVNDLAGTRANFGRTTPAALNRFDFNRDGVIDANDVVLVRLNLHRGLPPVAPVAVADSTFSTTLLAPATRAPTSPTRRSVWDEVTAAAS
jgi:hypothetical protein